MSVGESDPKKNYTRFKIGQNYTNLNYLIYIRQKVVGIQLGNINIYDRLGARNRYYSHI